MLSLGSIGFGTLMIRESNLPVQYSSNKPNNGALDNDITPKKHAELLNMLLE